MRYGIYIEGIVIKKESARNEYSKIKMKASKSHPYDIEGYMDFKGKFIAEHLTRALNLWGHKPSYGTQICESCYSNNFQSHFVIKYHEGGMKHEFFEFKCKECSHLWEMQM